VGLGSHATPRVHHASRRRDIGRARSANLSEAGNVEGRNVTVECHCLEGQYDRLPAPMADLVRRRVAVTAIPDTSPARAATATIPIVFGAGENPVQLVLSPASPDRPAI
jgi:hypothetical protein